MHKGSLSIALRRVIVPLLQPERFLWHPTDISPAFVSWESNSTQQMGNRAVFQEVTVTASHANPSPAGTCTACELH